MIAIQGASHTVSSYVPECTQTSWTTEMLKNWKQSRRNYESYGLSDRK